MVEETEDGDEEKDVGYIGGAVEDDSDDIVDWDDSDSGLFEDRFNEVEGERSERWYD